MSHILACFTMSVSWPFFSPSVSLSLISSFSSAPKRVRGTICRQVLQIENPSSPPLKMRVAYAPPRYENRRLSRGFPSRAAVKILAALDRSMLSRRIK